jgi:ribosomal protein S18 acetylase RimI-like enzyme
MDAELRIERAPDGVDVQTLRERIYEYNVASTGGLEGEELAIFVRGDDGEIRGGLYGWTWGGYLEVNQLWVHEQERGRGLGSRLLAAAEAEGRARGAHTAILDTHSFQAPDFYRRHGYEVYATVEGYPTGHRKLYLRKRIRPDDDDSADGAGAKQAG